MGIKETLWITFGTVFFIACESTKTEGDEPKLKDTVIVQQAAKPTEQVYVEEIGKLVGSASQLVEKGIENKRIKDSTLIAEKEEIWVYTIGVPYEDISDLITTCEKLKEIKGIAIYEHEKKFTIIKMGNSKDQLEDFLMEFKTKLDDLGIVNKKIAIINLSKKCGARESLVSHTNKKIKNKNPNLSCYKCR